jgi:hypothetical protein
VCKKERELTRGIFEGGRIEGKKEKKRTWSRLANT